MRIWGNAPGEAGERRTDRSPPGVSRGMVKAICPVLTGRMGKRAWYQAPRPVLTHQCSLAMAAPQPIENQQRSYEVFEKKHYMECTTICWGCPAPPRSATWRLHALPIRGA